MSDALHVLAFVTELDPRSSAANLSRLHAAADAAGDPGAPPERRVALLPERFWRDDDESAYREAVVAFARRRSCWVVGGSLHADRADGSTVNTGLVAAPDGTVAGAYVKRHPFAAEALCEVVPGAGPAVFDFAGRRAVVCICADLFDPALFAAVPADVVGLLVCAASTSRKPDPAFARALWTHVAVARAWECNAYVVISDWASAPHMPGVNTSGVSGFVDPSRQASPFFTAAVPPASWFRLEPEPLRRLEQDRTSRNFLWR